MNLFGRLLTRQQVQARMELRPLRQAGEEIHLSTGRLQLCILPGRGLDIAQASYKALPLTYDSKVGTEARDGVFLRHFFGGLLTTCGPENTGPACEYGGALLPQHGSFNVTAARLLQCESAWQGDELISTVKGELRFAQVFGQNLVVTRTITSCYGQDRVTIEDVVENNAFAPQELMLLYHMNFGYPFLDEDLKLRLEAADTQSLDGRARPEECFAFHPPVEGYAEQVFVHTGVKNNQVTLQNHGITLRLTFDNLPCLVQWKQLGAGDYALGLEPATAPPIGAAKAKAQNKLVCLAPFERYVTRLTLEAEDDCL